MLLISDTDIPLVNLGACEMRTTGFDNPSITTSNEWVKGIKLDAHFLHHSVLCRRHLLHNVSDYHSTELLKWQATIYHKYQSRHQAKNQSDSAESEARADAPVLTRHVQDRATRCCGTHEPRSPPLCSIPFSDLLDDILDSELGVTLDIVECRTAKSPPSYQMPTHGAKPCGPATCDYSSND